MQLSLVTRTQPPGRGGQGVRGVAATRLTGLRPFQTEISRARRTARPQERW
jgi:hypothetical protein